MNLKQYLADDDPSKWYRLSSGEMENLFDEAMLSVDVLVEALQGIKDHESMKIGVPYSDDRAYKIAYRALSKARGEA